MISQLALCWNTFLSSRLSGGPGGADFCAGAGGAQSAGAPRCKQRALHRSMPTQK